MKDFINKNIKDIKPSGIRKFFDIANMYDDVISLSVGEPDFETPYEIVRAGIDALEDGKTFYTSNSGLESLRNKICEYYKRKYNCNYENKEVLVTAGSSESIDISLRALIEEGDEVIILSPSYVSYEPCIKMCGGLVKTINLKEENNFELTKEELLAAITNKTKVLLLNYPNNPTGATLSYKNLLDIASICKEKDIFVISDEIYSELVYNKEFISIASLEGMKERTLVINGFSKAYSMTGWRLGYLLGPSNIVKEVTKIHQFVIMCAPTISQYAALVALDIKLDKEVEKMRLEYDRRRIYLINSLRKLGLNTFEPTGAFYVFPSIKKFNMKSEEFCLKLLEEEKVAVVPGTAFGEAGEGYIRISYAYSLEDLNLALDKIEAFINKIS